MIAIKKIKPAAFLCSLVLSAATLGCQPMDDQQDNPEIAQFRAAIPSADQLMAPTAKASIQSSHVLGERAIYPDAAFPIVSGINGSVTAMITLLKFITTLPPTLYNSATHEYVWGPFPNNDGVGYVGAYIKDTGGSGDFRYEYAFLRGIDNDLAKLVPVIYGGATPDENNDERGIGVTVWDFEADREFNQANDPDFDPTSGDRGRFAALYGNWDQNDPNNHAVVAVLRDFVSEEEPSEAAIDLDYFYGHFMDASTTIDFLDFELALDISEPTDGVRENVGARMAFLNGGLGRAEADASGGTMTSGERGTVTECWDAALNQTFLELVTTDGGTVTQTVTDGELTNCGPFADSLDDLGIPSLQDVPSDLIAALDDVATNGIPAP